MRRDSDDRAWAGSGSSIGGCVGSSLGWGFGVDSFYVNFFFFF